jgi:hypothetical protein
VNRPGSVDLIDCGLIADTRFVDDGDGLFLSDCFNRRVPVRN